jgi:mono/diheme cytochrome c family protein
VATGNNNVLTIKNGATLRASFGVSNTIYLANVGAANMVVENGAVVSADGGCFVGVGAGTSGVLTIQGGSLIVAGGLYVGFDSNSSGRVIIESGRAIVGALTIGPDDVIDIRGGTLSILHDVRHAVSSYVSQGNIVGYSGTGSVACIYEGDCTTVSATSGAAQSVSFDQEDQNFRKESREAIEGQIGGLDFDEVVFAVRQPGRDGHWYANFSHYCWDPSAVLYGDGGRLCALNIKTGKLRTLLEDPKGGVRDPQVHYDGEKILFSYRRGGQPYYHLYEINVDGSGLRQLTNGPYDDIEPSYLPDGGIIFCSSRVNCNVPCYYTRVAVLYRCDCDGSNIRRLSANVEHENTPWPMLDGRILYQRWEYVDRSQVMFHHLWTTNPDGTGQMVYFGNTHGGGAFLDAKPIPDSNKVVMIRSPGHGQLEHEGFVEFVHPLGGPDDRSSVRRITPLARWRDPYPISDKLLLVAGPGRHQISLLDHDGANFPVLTLPSEDIASNMWANEPRPIRSRLRERVIPSRVNLKKTTGTIILQDVYAGRNMTGVEPGDIKKLLVIEVLHMPVKPSRDWQQMVSFDSGTGGSFLLERIVGTVPVEEDGSAYFEAPAMRPLFFVALDEDNLSVKRMQSFTTVQPGERVSCIGCHEDRVGAPPVRRSLLATRRTASTIQPIADIPDVFDYPRDIQPILNKHCIPCHGYEKTEPGGPYAGKVLLSGERGIFYNQSYAALRAKRQVADGFNGPGNSAPRTIGTSASPLMKKLDGQHYGVQLSSNEKNMIRYWIESAGTFAGTYAALGKGFIIPTKPVVPDDVHTRRCVTCHEGELPFSKDDFRTHWFYNLDQPQKSVALLAPLAKAAGGWGMCTTDGVENGGSVFQDKTDPDHAKILAGIENLAVQLNHNKRYDMQGLEPHPAYTREMKAWGILPEDYEWSGYEDMFTTDRAYWESLQYRHEPLENEKH